MLREIKIEEIKPLNDYLSAAIDRPFEVHEIERLELNLNAVEKLDQASNLYHAQFLPFMARKLPTLYEPQGDRFFPSKRESELWPGLFHQRTTIRGQSLGQQVAGLGDLETVTKKILLFCHGVFIDPPIFTLPGSVVSAEDSVRLARTKLLNYARIAPHLARRLVVPVPLWTDPAAFTENLWSMPYGDFKPDRATKDLIRAVANRLRSKNDNLLRQDAERAVIQALLDQNASKQRLNFFDPLFEDHLEAAAFSEAIAHLNYNITSRMKLEPLLTHRLTTSFGIRPEQVTSQDIQMMRDEDELFALWRQMLRGALKHLIDNTENYQDTSRELKEYVAEHEKEWQEKARGVVGRGVLQHIIDTGQDVVSSFVSGAVVGSLLDPTKGPALGGTAASIKPLIKLMTGLPIHMSKSNQRLSLRNHFLAVGAKF